MLAQIVVLLLVACSGVYSAVRCSQSDLLQLRFCSCLKEPNSIALECVETNTSLIQKDFSFVYPSGEQVSSLQIRNSDLSEFVQLPDNYYDTLKTLELADVIIKQEIVQNLIKFSTNLENFVYDKADISHLKRDFFTASGVKSKLLKIKLLNDNIKDIDNDAFADIPSLETIALNDNFLNSIPRSVFNAKSLKVLDLSGNNIRKVSNDEATELSKLKFLSDLNLDKLNCSCELKDQTFLTYVKDKKFANVLCLHPAKLNSKPVMQLTNKDICDGGNSLIASFALIAAAIFFCIKN